MLQAIRPAVPIWVAAHGVVELGASPQPITADAGRVLEVWRRQRGLEQDADAVTDVPAPVESSRHAYSVALCESLLTHYSPAQRALVFVHGGPQVPYRTPQLQGLLQALPEVTTVATLRSDAARLPLESVVTAFALLGKSHICLVLRDTAKRLRAATDPRSEGAIEHLLLSRTPASWRVSGLTLSANEPTDTDRRLCSNRNGPTPAKQLRIPLAAPAGQIVLLELVEHDDEA